MKDFFKLAKSRQSCRSFSDAAVDQESLKKIVDTALLSPSACNGQPWRFHVVIDPTKKSQLAKSMQAFTEKAGAFIVIEEQKPVTLVKIANTLKHQDLTSVDIGIATAHIVFAAEALGLATCIIGWFKEGLIKETLAIADKRRVRIIVAIGHAEDATIRPKKRKPLKEAMRFLDEQS